VSSLSLSLSYHWRIIRALYIVPATTEERLTISPALAAALTVTVTGVLIVGAFPGPLPPMIQTAMRTFFAG